MARFMVEILEMKDDEARSFAEVYTSFMKVEIIPHLLGVKTISFRVELAENGGYHVVCDTNRQLNSDSQAYIRDLTRGFLAGWNAKYRPKTQE